MIRSAIGTFGRPAKAPRKNVPPRHKNPFEQARNQELANEALRDSICLRITYESLPRLVGVHTVGITTAGRPGMSVYQVDGEAKDGPVPNWRLFCFDNASTLR